LQEMQVDAPPAEDLQSLQVDAPTAAENEILDKALPAPLDPGVPVGPPTRDKLYPKSQWKVTAAMKKSAAAPPISFKDVSAKLNKLNKSHG
jgi:hypothetical protein